MRKHKNVIWVGLFVTTLFALPQTVSADHERSNHRGLRNEIQRDRQDLRDSRQQLEKDRNELRQDFREYQRDLRSGASRKELARDKAEIRESLEDFQDSRREVKRDRRELNRDLREYQWRYGDRDRNRSWPSWWSE